MPKVNIKLGRDIAVERADHTIEVTGIGKLVFSQGSVEWIPSGNSVNHYTLTWKQFGKILEEGGAAVQKRDKPAGPQKPTAEPAPAKKVGATTAKTKSPEEPATEKPKRAKRA